MSDYTELEGSMHFGGGLSSSAKFSKGMSGTMGFDGIDPPTGTFDYEELHNKPSIEGVELTGDRLLTEFGETTLSNMEIKEIFDRVFGKDQ